MDHYVLINFDDAVTKKSLSYFSCFPKRTSSLVKIKRMYDKFHLHTYFLKYLCHITTDKGKYYVMATSEIKAFHISKLELLLIKPKLKEIISKSNNKWYRLLRTKKIRRIGMQLALLRYYYNE
jgi:hypothetical protein